MSILSIVTPIGVLIGIIVTVHMEQAGGAHGLAIGVLQGLAAGTLLYITFYEVLARDKLSRYGMGGLVGSVAVLAGFLLMAGMEEGGGGHSHGGDGGHVGNQHEGHGGHHHELHEAHHGGHHEGVEEEMDRAVALLKRQRDWEREGKLVTDWEGHDIHQGHDGRDDIHQGHDHQHHDHD